MGDEKARSVRFPLQTGESALASFAAGMAMLVLATGLHAISISRLVTEGDPFGSTLFSTAGVFVFFYGLRCFQLARARRASDLLFGDRGIAVQGGRLDGRSWSWAEISPSRSDIVRVVDGRERVAHLVLGLGTLDSQQLAEADTEDETASLEVLLAMLRSPRWRGTPAAPASPEEAARALRPAGTTVLVCPVCGAPAVPADDATVTCRYCQRLVEVPADLRERIRASAQLTLAQERTALKLRRILDQPPAARVNALFTTSVCLVAVFGVIGVLTGHALSLVAELALVGGALSLLVHATAGRRAFRAVALFGAVEPARPGEPYACRRCRAPLPAQDAARVLVTCPYCEAENVLGLDLRREAGEASAAQGDLDAALRGRALRDVRVLTPLVFPAVLVLVFFVLRGGLVQRHEDRQKAVDEAQAKALAAAVEDISPTTARVAEKHGVRLPRSSARGASGLPLDPALVVTPTKTLLRDLEIPDGSTGASVLRTALEREDAVLVSLSPDARSSVRLVVDRATPVRKLAQVAAVLGPRDATLAVVTAAGGKDTYGIVLPKAAERVLRVRDGVVPELAGGDGSAIACTVPASADATPIVTCLERLGTPRPRVAWAPPLDVDLQRALELRDALVASSGGVLDVTLDLASAR